MSNAKNPPGFSSANDLPQTFQSFQADPLVGKNRGYFHNVCMLFIWAILDAMGGEENQ